MIARATQRTKVSRELLVAAADAISFVNLPPVPWVVKGPRGGHYLATGRRERLIAEIDNDWEMNTVTVIDRSEGAKYLRPEQARRLAIR